ncbi:MAG: hypothetical protein H6822_25635 [Planctomycetaceae bacterium]|nr:hypothetical protein [Planctomycetaceae bacterium]
MPSIIELHDSIVHACIAHGEDIVVHLSPAYLHRTTGHPGVDAGDVFTLDLDLKFSDAVIDEPFVDLPVQLADGRLSVGATCFDNAVPFPFNHSGFVTAEFVDCYGRVARITSRSLILRPASKEIFLESFPGTDS